MVRHRIIALKQQITTNERLNTAFNSFYSATFAQTISTCKTFVPPPTWCALKAQELNKPTHLRS